MFAACQNHLCADYNKAKTVPDGTDLTGLMCGVCSLYEFTAVNGPAVATPPPPPPVLDAPDLTGTPSGTPTWVEVSHNGKNYALPLTPIPSS